MKNSLGLLLFILAFACTDPKLAEVERMTDEVIDLHDQMMPLMDDMYKTRMSLQKAAEQDTLKREKMTETIGQLTIAEEAMMNWMRNFNPTFRGATHDETLTYLNGQKITMQQVADQMTEALDQGKTLAISDK